MTGKRGSSISKRFTVKMKACRYFHICRLCLLDSRKKRCRGFRRHLEELFQTARTLKALKLFEKFGAYKLHQNISVWFLFFRFTIKECVPKSDHTSIVLYTKPSKSPQDVEGYSIPIC